MKCKSYKYLSQTYWFWTVKRETLKAGEEQEDWLFICLVCSLQQRSLQIIWALKRRTGDDRVSFDRFHLLHYRFQTVWSRLIGPPWFFFFFLNLNHRKWKWFCACRRIYVVLCDLVRRQKAKNKKEKKKPACFCSCWSLWVYCRSISRSFSSLHLIKADRDFILAPSGRPGLYCRWCSSQAIKTIRAPRLFVLITSAFTSLLHNKSAPWKGLCQLALTPSSVYYYCIIRAVL